MIRLSNNVFLGLIAFLFATVSIQLIPLSKKASIWNRCLDKTTATLSKVKSLEKMDDHSKEVLSVMICNGAVFEPKIKTNIQ